MKQTLKIGVSQDNPKESIVAFKKVSLSKRLMNKLLGLNKVAIIVPEDTVASVVIEEVDRGEK